jgi:nitrogen regulatory protein P-II 2
VKLIVAVIQPHKLNAIREALEKIEVFRMTVCDSQAFGTEGARVESFRGMTPTTNVYRKVTLEIIVNDDFLERTIDIVTKIARTGQEGASGDGNIFVVQMDEIYNVKDSSHGPGAV